MRAGHFFASKCGEEAMTAIFGIAELDKFVNPEHQADEPGSNSELFTAVNGIFWSKGCRNTIHSGPLRSGSRP